PAVVHLARKDRAVAGLRDPAQPLHDRRRQADLVACDGTSAGRLLDLLKAAADRISLLDARRIDLRRQDLGRPAAAEQFDDMFRLLPRIESGHSCLSALRTTEAQRAQRNNIYDINVSGPSIRSLHQNSVSSAGDAPSHRTHHVRLCEIFTLVQKRKPARLRQGIRHTITKIVTCGMPSLAEPNERGSAFARQFPIKGYDFDPSPLHKRIKTVGQCRLATSNHYHRRFEKSNSGKKTALRFDYYLGEGFCFGFFLKNRDYCRGIDRDHAGNPFSSYKSSSVNPGFSAASFA